MVKLTPTHSLLALLALARLGAASCIPSEGEAPANGGSGDAKFVVYSDKWINGQQMPPPPDQIKVCLTFVCGCCLPVFNLFLSHRESTSCESIRLHFSISNPFLHVTQYLVVPAYDWSSGSGRCMGET